MMRRWPLIIILGFSLGRLNDSTQLKNTIDSNCIDTELDNLISAETRIFRKQDSEYQANAYQYAKSSHDGMSPNIVIYPESLQEILNIIDFAKKNKLGVAVRTGGHQYSGASSTSGENILVDLSDTFEDPDADFLYDEKTNILRIGISFSLKEYYDMLAKGGMFTPGGICSHVHLGGHVQTGGYGMLTRSFGLLSDYVEGFDIVLADGEKARVVTVWKPDSEFAAKLTAGNDDLFWAVMGGSPGNFGILTHVRIRPLHDKDYPDSRMMNFNTEYTAEKHHAVESILAEMSGDPELSKDYNFFLSIQGPKTPRFNGPKIFEKKNKIDHKLNEDEMMMYRHGDEYGDGVPWAEKGEGSSYKMMDDFGPYWEIPHSLITKNLKTQLVIFFTWHNVNGAEETFPKEAREWFERLRLAAGGEGNIRDRELNNNIPSFPQLLKWAMGLSYDKVDFNLPIPISKQILLFSYNEIREFNQPAHKRTYTSEKYDLHTNGYVDWVVQRVKELDKFGEENDYSVNVVLQNFFTGGRHSAYYNGNTELNAHSWKKDINYISILDAFYDPYSEKAKEFAKKWVEKNDIEVGRDGGGGIFSEFDRRFLWSTFGKASDPDQGAIMDSIWNKYFDSREKYNRLIAIKRRFDPRYVFTANGFGVDATSAPHNQCIKITKN